jgi:hypothetical protein
MAKAIAIGAFAITVFLCGLSGPAWSDEIDACSSPGLKLELQTASDASIDLIPIPKAKGPAARRAPGPIVEGALQRAIEHIAVPMEPADIRPFAAPHPFFPTAAGTLKMSRGQVVVVAIDSPYGPMLARFVKTTGPATPEELTSFRRSVAALRLEPGSYCSGTPSARISSGTP